MSPGVFAWESSARSKAFRQSKGDGPCFGACHLASSPGRIWGAFHEFQVRRWPSIGDIRVATPGAWTSDFRRVSTPLISGLDRSYSCSSIVVEVSVGRSKASPANSRISFDSQALSSEVQWQLHLILWEYSRNAARSSGDAFFLTSCNRRIAASMSDWVVETRDTFDSGRCLRFVVEFRRLRTKERSAEPDLE